MTRSGARVALVVVSIVVSLALAEGVLRVAGYRYRPLQITTGTISDAREYHLFGDRNFIYDAQLIWRPKPGYGVFNELGFRGPEVGVRSDKVRIATVGDSNTLGWAEEDGANWPADLERLLTAGGTEVEVVNAGVWGYSSHQGVPRTREVLELEPDIVLISFGSNDAHFVTRSDAEFANRSLGRRWLDLAARRLRLAELWTAVAARSEPADVELRRRVNEDDYRHNLRTMIDDVRQAGARPVLLTRPYVGPLVDASHWKGRAPEYNLATVEVAEELGVLLVDVFSFFKEMDGLFADESHFTREGHEWAARVILEHLRAPLAAI